MRDITIKIAIFTFTTFIFTVSHAGAQCGPALQAEIPFDFVVNGREAKAGTYLIEKSNCGASTPIVVLRDASGRSLGVTIRSVTGRRTRPSATSIIFVGYGDKRFLSEVNDPDGRYSFRVGPGKARVALARGLRPTRTSIPVTHRRLDARY